MHPSLRLLAAAGFALAAATGAHAQQGDQPFYPAGTPTASVGAQSTGAAASGAATAGAAMAGERSMPMGSAMHSNDAMHGGMGKRQGAQGRDVTAYRGDMRGNHQGRPIIPGA